MTSAHWRGRGEVIEVVVEGQGEVIASLGIPVLTVHVVDVAFRKVTFDCLQGK